MCVSVCVCVCESMRMHAFVHVRAICVEVVLVCSMPYFGLGPWPTSEVELPNDSSECLHFELIAGNMSVRAISLI